MDKKIQTIFGDITISEDGAMKLSKRQRDIISACYVRQQIDKLITDTHTTKEMKKQLLKYYRNQIIDIKKELENET